MARVEDFVEIYEKRDENDKMISRSETRTTRKVEPLGEPDYIKLYTKMWCEFNNIPVAYRNLFMELVIRMSYANATDIQHSQTVYTGKPYSDCICKTLGWKTNMYQKGLKVLCDCGAIRRINRGVYQINPSYAGRGTWKYNPKLKQGGVQDLVAVFNFRERTVETNIDWVKANTMAMSDEYGRDIDINMQSIETMEFKSNENEENGE